MKYQTTISINHVHLRPGDKIVAVDGYRFKPGESVEVVRNMLRGEPGSEASITFERVGLKGDTTIKVPRKIVQMRGKFFLTTCPTSIVFN